MPSTDAELVEAARGGRAAAFEELVRRHAARVSSLCWARLGRRGPIEDMVQETFLRAYRSLPSLVDAESFPSWLVGIAVRTTNDWKKARARSERSLEDLPPGAEPGGHSPGDAGGPGGNGDEGDDVLAAVQELPEIYRDAVALFYYEQKSYAEMSAVLGIGPSAVNARLTKARSLLRERLRRSPR